MQSPKVIAAKLQAVAYAATGSSSILFDCAKVCLFSKQQIENQTSALAALSLGATW
jgi:hypothetical protein